MPDFKDWIDATPVIVDAKNSRDRWEVIPDDSSNPGWFRFLWNKDAYWPENFYFYRKTDSLFTSPIGKNGYALGRTELLLFGLEASDSLLLVPNLSYFCWSKGEEIYGDPEIVYLTDIRKIVHCKNFVLKKISNRNATNRIRRIPFIIPSIQKIRLLSKKSSF